MAENERDFSDFKKASQDLLEALRWQTQTRFGGPDSPPGERGDCLSATMASLFGLQLAEVPVFMEQDDWWGALQAWLRLQGYQAIQFEWGPWVEDVVGALVEVVGKSPRGHDHSVVWRLGEGMVWDPHPSREGLVGEPKFVTFLVPLDPSL